MRRYRAIVFAGLAAGLLHCGGCDKSTGLADEGRRLWGRQKIEAAVQAQAERPIDAGQLHLDRKALERVVTMSFDEVVARFGFLRLESTATFELTRNGHRVPILEKTVIEHGIDGTFRIVQKDEDDDVTREIIYSNGVMYYRNGAKGKMRAEGMAEHRRYALREEVWSPLKAFTGYYGPRLGVRSAGTGKVSGRRAVRYRFVLLDGPERVRAADMKGEKAPVDLAGELWVDQKTGVPSKVKLRGELQIPGAPGTPPGVLKISLNSKIAATKGEEFRPESSVPAIAHRPVDLDPLRFLKEDTRTSTVIGGGR